MNQKGFSSIALVIGIVIVVGVAGLVSWNIKGNPSPAQENTPVNQQSNTNANAQESSVEVQVRNAIEKVLSQDTLPNPNEQMPKAIKLLSVDVNENKVTLNFSKEITSKGQAVFEDIFSLVSNAIHPIIQGEGIDPKYSELNFIVLVEGKSGSEIFQ
jgi:hypothetical protein